MTEAGAAAGLVGAHRRAAYRTKAAGMDAGRAMLQARSMTPPEAAGHGIRLNQDGQRRTASAMLGAGLADRSALVRVWPELEAVPAAAFEQLEIEARYESYLVRQRADVAAFERDEHVRLPDGLDYEAISGLSIEVRSKLAAQRPTSLGAAARIPGVTPAALTRLLSFLKSRSAA